MLPLDDDAHGALLDLRTFWRGVRRFLRIAAEALGLRRLLGRARKIFTNAEVVPPVLVSTGLLVATVGVALALVGPPAPGRANGLTSMRASADLGMAASLAQHTAALNLPAATTTPNPAPPSVASAPALRPHEVFGFAPYWALDQSSGFDLSGLTTLAYFALDVNPDGSLSQSGPGWDGYQSQALADLISRAHAAGDRVVLSVGAFDQSVLDQLTSSATAPATLSAALVQAVGAKNLDGVNLDLEGEGSSDQAGLTNLVGQVSKALHAANPHYQVTMDTYASSAGDSGGFYDIKALAPEVDGFFVMAYELNLQSAPNPASPLTSSDFSTAETLKEYTAAVDPQKVVLGIGFYGEEWTTTDGTMAAQATGGPTTPADAQILAGGHPTYWDPITDTAWTSFQENGVWHEQYFEDPSSLYLVAQMAQLNGIDGLGIWALGMDGNDPAYISALSGNAPAVKDALAGPPSTSPSAGAPSAGAPAVAGELAPVNAPSTPPSSTSDSSTTASSSSSPTPSPATTPSTSDAPTTTAPNAPTTTTSPSSTTTTTTAPHETGLWQGTTVTLTPVAAGTPNPTGTPTYMGILGDFSTTDPTYTCLQPPPSPGPVSTTTTTAPPVPPSQPSSNVLNVWAFGANPTVYEVVATHDGTQPVDCMTATFTFPVPTTHPGDGSTSTTTTSSTTTTTTVSPSTEP